MIFFPGYLNSHRYKIVQGRYYTNNDIQQGEREHEYPVFAMAMLTFAVGTLILTTPINSVITGIVRIGYYEIFRGGGTANICQICY